MSRSKNRKKRLPFLERKQSSFFVATVRIVLFLLIIVLLLEYVPRDRYSEFLFPKPTGILNFYIQEADNLIISVKSTSLRFLFCFGVGSLIGISIGLLLPMFKFIQTELGMVQRFFFAVPRTITLFFVLLFNGFNEETILIFGTFIAALYTSIYTARDVQAVLSGEHELSRDVKYALKQYYDSRFDVLMEQTWPLTRRARYSALHFCSLFLWPTFILSEGLAKGKSLSLGAWIWDIRAQFDPEQLFALTIILVLLIVTTSAILNFLERYTKLF